MAAGIRHRRMFAGRRFRWERTVWGAVLLLTLIGYRLIVAPSRLPDVSFDPSEQHFVERVVDGDTLLLKGGVRVRLIGVDTPESVKPNSPVEPLGLEAAEFTRSQVEKRTVRLEFDRERRDRYQRILAYVYLGDTLLNEELIRAGFSRAETRFPYDSGMKRRFINAEKEARHAHRGLWADVAGPRQK